MKRRSPFQFTISKDEENPVSVPMEMDYDKRTVELVDNSALKDAHIRLACADFSKVEAMVAEHVESGKDLYSEVARKLYDIPDGDPLPNELRMRVKSSLWFQRYSSTGRINPEGPEMQNIEPTDMDLTSREDAEKK